jgi:hypothetical protein
MPDGAPPQAVAGFCSNRARRGRCGDPRHPLLHRWLGNGSAAPSVASRTTVRAAPTRCLLRGVHVLTPADSAGALRSHHSNAGSTCRTGFPSSSDGDPTQGPLPDGRLGRLEGHAPLAERAQLRRPHVGGKTGVESGVPVVPGSSSPEPGARTPRSGRMWFAPATADSAYSPAPVSPLPIRAVLHFKVDRRTLW